MGRDSRRPAADAAGDGHRSRRLSRAPRQPRHRFRRPFTTRISPPISNAMCVALANVGNLRDFERFLRACALRSANLLNKADLARDVESPLLPPTNGFRTGGIRAGGPARTVVSNRTESIVKSPKLYLADTGLLCALLNLRSEEPPPIAGGGADLGNVRFCATARSRTPGRTRRQPVFGATAPARWISSPMSADVWSSSRRSGRNCRPVVMLRTLISCARWWADPELPTAL